MAMPYPLSARLRKWYALHGRRLPWRETRDPYKILVSEFMLQQTQVETAIPYYQRWLERFPNIQAVAAASEQAVLAVWEGLGYYARARHLHQAARHIVRDWDGEIPRTVEHLRALPGVGPYTAGAVASLAFGVDAAVLDGNVARVLARVYDMRLDVKSSRGQKELWRLAQSLLPPGQAADHNQALMELGAMVCTPRAPKCEACPVRGLCAARKLGLQLERPITARRAPSPHRTAAAGVVRKNGRVLLVRRPADKLLGGLWAFPGADCHAREARPACLRRALRQEFGLEVQVGPQTQTLTHTFTHFRLTQHVFECRWLAGTPAAQAPEFKWARVAELGRYPMGKVDRQIARRLQALAVK